MVVHFASKQVAIIFLKKVPNGTIIAKISTILDFLFFDIFFYSKVNHARTRYDCRIHDEVFEFV